LYLQLYDLKQNNFSPPLKTRSRQIVKLLYKIDARTYNIDTMTPSHRINLQKKRQTNPSHRINLQKKQTS